MTRILVVDDEPEIRENLRIGLEARNYEVVTAANGEEAIREAEKREPDVILLDVMMPKMNGMDACTLIKQRLANFVPIIMVTAKGDVESKEKGVTHGADDYITKPFSIRDLVTRIIAMERIKVQQEYIKRLTYIDPVTGAHNRRYFRPKLRGCIEKQETQNVPFSILLIDLDDYKSVNELYGHLFGDSLLKSTSMFLEKMIRPKDVFVRYGDDEFAVLMPGTAQLEAKDLAQRMRKSLKRKEFIEDGQPIRLTCSIGVVTFSRPYNLGVESAMAVVDHALLHAKLQGSDTVEVHSPTTWMDEEESLVQMRAHQGA